MLYVRDGFSTSTLEKMCEKSEEEKTKLELDMDMDMDRKSWMRAFKQRRKKKERDMVCNV